MIILPRCTEVHGWDSIDLELFDLVEEIKDNFYGVLGLQQVRLIDIKVLFSATDRILNNGCLLSKNDQLSLSSYHFLPAVVMKGKFQIYRKLEKANR